MNKPLVYRLTLISLSVIVTAGFSRGGRGIARPGALTIDYPLDGTLFPPELPAPVFRWTDFSSGSDTWRVLVEFRQSGRGLSASVDAPEWTPTEEQWEVFKELSLEKIARVTIRGVNHRNPEAVLSAGRVTVSTSRDEVGAPIFYREVNLPFIDAVKDPSNIRWRFGPVSSKGQPPVILENLPVCGNCHSFSADGTLLGMDVDYANEKGSYALLPIEEEMVINKSKIITWSDYRREDGEQTYGLLSQISPDGRFVVSTVKDRSVSPGTNWPSRSFFSP
jgi:hypothetical protein